MKKFPQILPLWIGFLLTGILTLSADQPKISSLTAGNITPSGFTLFWQGTEDATPGIAVFSDSTEYSEITPSVRIEFFPLSTGDVTLSHSHSERTERRTLQNHLKSNGFYTARISGLSPATDYFVAADLSKDGSSVRFPSDNRLVVKTASHTAMVRESLQIAIAFPSGENDGLIVSLSTPNAAKPLFTTVGDSGFSNRAFFNLSDFIDADSGTNLEINGSLPLTVQLHLPDESPSVDDNPSISFTKSFVVARATDLIFSGTGLPQVVKGFVFDEIGPNTAGVPFNITIRAVDALGNPMTAFTGVAELTASGTMLAGSGTTAEFTSGVLKNHSVTFATPGEYRLSVELPDGTARSLSESFLITGSFDQWLDSLFPNPGDRNNPALTAPDADPFGTGITNLLAYATGIDPQNPNLNLLPKPLLHEVTTSGSTYLAITFARQKGTADVEYIPEVSGELLSWTSGAGVTETVSIIDHGSYEMVTVRDTVPFETGNRRFMRLRVRSQESFSAWQSRYFAGIDPALSSDDADPAGDGIPNLMKYALGLDPFKDETNNLPKENPVAVDDESYLILSFVRPKNRTDIDYIVELSDNKIDWYPGGALIERLFNIDRHPNELIIVRDIRPLLPGEQRGIRLNVKRR